MIAVHHDLGARGARARARVLAVAAVVAAVPVLAGCGADALSPSSTCADWNDADLNAHGTYIQEQIRAGQDGLRAYAGYAESGIDFYCADDPGANLGAVTTHVNDF